MNFSRNTRCLKCKAEGPKKVATDDIQMKKGDWNCLGPIFYDLLDDLATSMLVLLLQTKSHAYRRGRLYTCGPYTFCGKALNCIDIGGEGLALITAGGSDPILRIWDPRKPDNQESIVNKEENLMDESPFLKLKRFQWWLLVAINIFFLIAGQAAAVLLGRFYYDKGGNSQWMATLVQTAGFPVLWLLYLSASTYSLICATQLAFNAVFSYFLNSQKFTALILNSVVTLSLSAALIAVNDNSDGPSGVPKGKFLIGFLCTLGAFALYSLLLSFMQLSFQKVLKKETFSVVLEMQIYTSVVASCLSTIGLFASGEWNSLQHEMEVFGTGSVSYVLTLVWTAISWQLGLAKKALARKGIELKHRLSKKFKGLKLSFFDRNTDKIRKAIIGANDAIASALFRKIAAALPGMETLSSTKPEDMVDVNLKSSNSNGSQSQQESGGCAC
ncbi:hypothetical protein GOBAR_AA26828 [Gossypium barbadense]|uniref:Probable purine permease n=1 Tax=Gossypium barbadense TaxID=3634 RepID=A0A2P5WS00_GOSBA|nr:hypothetical protein GOBAR_AA26828 [Gossypium barbadense]